MDQNFNPPIKEKAEQLGLSKQDLIMLRFLDAGYPHSVDINYVYKKAYFTRDNIEAISIIFKLNNLGLIKHDKAISKVRITRKGHWLVTGKKSPTDNFLAGLKKWGPLIGLIGILLTAFGVFLTHCS